MNLKLKEKKVSFNRNFEVQKENQWFTEETFRSILRINGTESNLPSKYPGASHCGKIIL
jgi:hypothetical protein